MSFDTWTVAAIADELNRKLVPGRVQQVLQTGDDSLAFEVYAGGERRYLLASADRQAPRVHLVADKPRRGVDTPSPMLQLLRKFVRGAGLTGVTQPPWERILHFEFQHPQLGSTVFVAELIGRWANLLLLRPAQGEEVGGEWRILECVHRYRAQEPGARHILPGQLYEPPPAQAGWPPDTLTELRLRLLLEDARPEAPVWRVLVQGLLGYSPALAREMVFLALGDAQATVGQVQHLQPLLQAIARFVEMAQAGQWQPGVVADDRGVPVAFAAYPLQHRSGGFTAVDSISQAAERFYAGRAPGEGDPYGPARRQVEAMIQRAAGKLRRRQAAIQREVHPTEEIERWRASGEWILALATQIEPRQEALRLPEGVDLNTIRLDPALSPADNAAAYFKRYRKAKRAARFGTQRLADTAGELAYLDQLAADLALAGDRSEIDAVRAALVQGGYARRTSRPPATGAAAGGPRRFQSREGYTILVGRNSRQNEHVTFEVAGPDDLWLHARGLPGSHVVVRSGGAPVSQETQHQAAALAAYFSRGQNEAWVDVIVTERRRVRRAPGGRPGMVLVEDERVLRVRPGRPDA